MHFYMYISGHMLVISVDEVLLTLKAVTKHLLTSVGVGYNSRDYLGESLIMSKTNRL